MLFICVVWTVSQLCRCGQTKGDRIWTLMLTRPLTPAAVRLHSWRTKVHPVTADQSQRCSDRQISSVLLWSHKTGSRPIFIPSGATIRYNQEGEATFPRSRPDQISMGHARTSLNTGGPPCLELVLTHQGTNLHLVRWSQRPEVLRHQPGLWIPHIPISIHGSCRNRSDPLRPTIDQWCLASGHCLWILESHRLKCLASMDWICSSSSTDAWSHQDLGNSEARSKLWLYVSGTTSQPTVLKDPTAQCQTPQNTST